MVGCEYFCIDAGWHSDGEWWDGVGEWLPSKGRFPGGIQEPLNYIRSKGMIPGLWLELEVMGINCPLAKQVPDDWLFIRHGRLSTTVATNLIFLTRKSGNKLIK
jgi:alpha-galactosidase